MEQTSIPFQNLFHRTMILLDFTLKTKKNNTRLLTSHKMRVLHTIYCAPIFTV